MQVLLAVWVAGATRQSTDLVTSGAGFDAATSSLVVGGGSASGWGAMKVEDLTASTGTKIVFKWGNGHNVVMTNEAAFTDCKLGDGDSKCLATDGTANAVAGACEQGGNVVTKGTDNKYTYEAVMTSAGEYYFICGVPGHCGSQKIKVTVVPPGDLASPPPAAMSTASPPPASPPPAESSEDSAAASLGSGALGTALLVTATTALLRGFLF